MKRFHVHVSVKDLAESIRFYSAVFGAEPSVLKSDYAKWMLEDPRVNFAISTRDHAVGVNHLGFQTENDSELQGMRASLERADAALIEQTGQACCYAKSDKYWVTDPQGIAWETFHTLESIPVFGNEPAVQTAEVACCIPLAQSSQKVGKAAASSCCVPKGAAQPATGSCC
jgi:catechol 2,3-dioxygenase-like lactoylglutathione lyase family enzyme